VRIRESVTMRVLAVAAIAAAVSLLAGACSINPNFPAVLDFPAGRNDPKLSPDEVKRATDDLLLDRDHLKAEVAATPQTTAATGNATPPAKSAANKAVAKKKPPPKAQPVVAATATAPPAGTEAKP
jgi:hypothetical protein